MKKRFLKSLAVLFIILCYCLSAFIELTGRLVLGFIIVLTAIVETALLPLHYAFWLVTDKMFTYRVLLFILDADTDSFFKKLTHKIEKYSMDCFDAI
jgi:hypothetical protein